MKHSPTYIILTIVLAIASCADPLMETEHRLLEENKVVFAANSSALITRSGVQYTNFDEATKYLLYSLENDGSYDWNAGTMAMNDVPGTESSAHLIDYGDDLYFDGRKLDFFGATICSTTEVPERTPDSAGSEPVFSLRLPEEGDFDDLMYSKNLKGCDETMGLLNMNFTHALSKLQFEVVKAAGNTDDIKLTNISIYNTFTDGKLNIISGTWSLGTLAGKDAERVFHESESGLAVTTSAQMIQDADGNDKEMLIIPNETQETSDALTVRIGIERNGTPLEYEYPLYATVTGSDGTITTSDSPYVFTQNHIYRLTILIMNEGLKIITITPKVYDWIEKEPDTYMGQPVTFGGLMWMDRNLGATTWDCENHWADTRGFYYQYGRNIPYIFDVEKFRNRPKSDTYFTDSDGSSNTKLIRKGDGYKSGDRAVNLDTGYEYFFTYDDKGEKVYGAVQGGVLNGQNKYFVDGYWDGNVWKGTKLFTWLNANKPYYKSADGEYTVQEWNFYTAAPIGYNPSTGKYEENYSPKWQYADATSSNIAINPGDPGIYHFIFDARYYTDFYQSGSWCVLDNKDGCTSNSGYNRTETVAEGNYLKWLKSGCAYTTVEDTDKVNNFWVSRSNDNKFTPKPENHPCPKGWRIPTGEDFSKILPDPETSFYAGWGKNTSAGELILMANVKGKKTSDTEDIIYGKEKDGLHTIYVIKRKGESDCYRLRLKWRQSQCDRKAYYNISEDKYAAQYGTAMQYVEISRYTGNTEMSFDGLTTETYETSYRKLTSAGYEAFHDEFTDWEQPAETMQIPLCGFIYTGAGLDCLYFDGAMTILRCTDWNDNNNLRERVVEAGITDFSQVYNKCNEAQNWCAYLRTDNAQCGVFNGSRKSLGCQIRCVRDVNATDSSL